MKRSFILLVLLLSGCATHIKTPAPQTAPTVGFGGADVGFGGAAQPDNKLGAKLALSYPACVPGNGVQCTTPYGLWLPPHGYPNWDGPINYNTQAINNALSAAGGHPAAPSFYLQGANNGATAFSTDSSATPFKSAQITASTNEIISVIAPPYNAACNWNGTTGTDDTAALNAAWAAINALPGGGEILLPPAACYAPNGLNWATNVASGSALVVQGQGAASQIVTKNAPIGIDLGGTNSVYFNDFQLTEVGTTAKVGIARYRVSTSGGYTGGGHHYKNFWIQGAYSLAALYSIGIENDSEENVIITQLGAGSDYTTSSENCLNLTGQDYAIPSNSSNTVHLWKGGILGMAGAATGEPLNFCTGSADNLTFDGTYFDDYINRANAINPELIYFNSTTGSVQGSKIFVHARFEGDLDVFGGTAAEVDSLTVKESFFGEINDTSSGAHSYDFNFNNMASNSYGLHTALIENNVLLGQGSVINTVTRSKIHMGSTYNTPTAPATTLTISTLAMQSDLKSDLFSFGGSFANPGTTITYNNDTYVQGTSNTIYGPYTPTGSLATLGSTFSLYPFGIAPQSPTNNETVMADCVNWQPWLCATPTLAQWNAAASAWQSPVNSVPLDFTVGRNFIVGGSISNNTGGLGPYENLVECSNLNAGCAATHWTLCGGCGTLPTLTTGVENDIYGNPTVMNMLFTAFGGITANPSPTISGGQTYTMSVIARDPTGAGEVLNFGFGGGGAGLGCAVPTPPVLTTIATRYSVTCTLAAGTPIQQVYFQGTHAGQANIQFPQFVNASAPLPPVYTGNTAVVASTGFVLKGNPIPPVGGIGSQLMTGTGPFTVNHLASYSDILGTMADSGISVPLTGTTGTITGTSLSGTCDSGTASVTGAVVGSPVSVSSTTGADVGGAFNVRGSVTSTGTVTVYVCGTGTPSSLAYNVVVF